MVHPYNSKSLGKVMVLGNTHICAGLWLLWSWRVYQKDVCSHSDGENVADGWSGQLHRFILEHCNSPQFIPHPQPPAASSVPAVSHYPLFGFYHLPFHRSAKLCFSFLCGCHWKRCKGPHLAAVVRAFQASPPPGARSGLLSPVHTCEFAGAGSGFLSHVNTCEFVGAGSGFLSCINTCEFARSSQSTRWLLLTFTFFRKEEAYLGPINSAR